MLVAVTAAACATGEQLSEQPSPTTGAGSAGMAGSAGSGAGQPGSIGGGSGSGGSGGSSTAGSAGTAGSSVGAGGVGGAGTAGTGGGAGTGGSAGSAGTAGSASTAGSAGSAGTAATGGAGGAPGNDCGLIPDKATWVASKSTSGGDPAPQAIDADNGTRFSTGTDQAEGIWLQIDFGVSTSVNQVTLYSTSQGDYPRGYEITVSDTPVNYNGLPVASATGAYGTTNSVTFDEVATGRYLLIELTAPADVWWSVHELSVACD